MSAGSQSDSAFSVVIAGGGLAGIAAAAVLGQSGFRVTLLEAKQQLGGRTSSYVDAESGVTIDNCQHVSMGCCTAFSHLCQTLGVADAFRVEETLNFISPQGKLTRFQADNWPAPLHLTRAFWKLPYLSAYEKYRFARAVGKLAGTPRHELRGKNFRDWLLANRQTENLIRNVWEVVLVSALSESLERIDAAYAQKVFVDGFLSNRNAWKVHIPQVSLDELYSRRTLSALTAWGIQVRCQSRITGMHVSSGGVLSLTVNQEEQIEADDFVLAIPQHQLGQVVTEVAELSQIAEQISRIETAPITSVHLWFDRPVTDLPHAVFVDKLCQWVFARGKTSDTMGDGYLYQVVISASRQLAGVPQSEIVSRVVEEISTAWPAATSSRLMHSRMITERRAVFSATPGIDQFRPAQQSPIANLQLAGDWTQTGWPATMEGAVRSGYLAAVNILQRHKMATWNFPDELAREWLPKCLWKDSAINKGQESE